MDIMFANMSKGVVKLTWCLPICQTTSFNWYQWYQYVNDAVKLTLSLPICRKFQKSSLNWQVVPFVHTNRRVGRPRGKWADEGLEEMYVKHRLGTRHMFRNNVARECGSLEAFIRSRSIRLPTNACPCMCGFSVNSIRLLLPCCLRDIEYTLSTWTIINLVQLYTRTHTHAN